MKDQQGINIIYSVEAKTFSSIPLVVSLGIQPKPMIGEMRGNGTIVGSLSPIGHSGALLWGS